MMNRIPYKIYDVFANNVNWKNLFQTNKQNFLMLLYIRFDWLKIIINLYI